MQQHYLEKFMWQTLVIFNKTCIFYFPLSQTDSKKYTEIDTSLNSSMYFKTLQTEPSVHPTAWRPFPPRVYNRQEYESNVPITYYSFIRRHDTKCLFFSGIPKLN